MGFLDKLKSTAGNAMAAASDAARNVQDKGKEMTEKARLNKAIKNEESKINNLYIYISVRSFLMKITLLRQAMRIRLTE